jgi:hypothetical protein
MSGAPRRKPTQLRGPSPNASVPDQPRGSCPGGGCAFASSQRAGRKASPSSHPSRLIAMYGSWMVWPFLIVISVRRAPYVERIGSDSGMTSSSSATRST